MSDPQIKVIVGFLHTLHDNILQNMQILEKLLTLFGEDMSWYETWRQAHEKEKK